MISLPWLLLVTAGVGVCVLFVIFITFRWMWCAWCGVVFCFFLSVRLSLFFSPSLSVDFCGRYRLPALAAVPHLTAVSFHTPDHHLAGSLQRPRYNNLNNLAGTASPVVKSYLQVQLCNLSLRKWAFILVSISVLDRYGFLISIKIKTKKCVMNLKYMKVSLFHDIQIFFSS